MLNFNRRDFLKAGAAVSLAAGLPRSGSAQGTFAPQPGAWREFQIVTRLEIANAKSKTQAWIPVPVVNEKDWFKSSPNQWTTNGNASLERDAHYGAEMVRVEWPNLDSAPVAEVTSTIKVRDRAVDLSKTGNPAALSAAELKLYTGGTELIPTDGIVKQTSDRITKGTATDLEKARVIYAWVVENTFRDAKVRGCGIGDIASMLRPAVWAANALTSMHFTSAWHARQVSRRATSTAYAWHHRSSATRAWVPDLP